MIKVTASVLSRAGLYQTVPPAEYPALDKFLRENTGRRLCITLSVENRPSTDPQRKYYWGFVIPPLVQFTGNAPRAMHRILKTMFLIKKIKIESPEGPIKVNYMRSIKDLSTKEMEEYLSKIRTWASVKFRLFIPMPREEGTVCVE